MKVIKTEKQKLKSTLNNSLKWNYITVICNKVGRRQKNKSKWKIVDNKN